MCPCPPLEIVNLFCNRGIFNFFWFKIILLFQYSLLFFTQSWARNNCSASATTTTRQNVRASVTNKNSKTFRPWWPNATTNITNKHHVFWAWKHGHVVAKVLTCAQYLPFKYMSLKNAGNDEEEEDYTDILIISLHHLP